MQKSSIWYVGLPSDDHPINSKLGRYFAATSYIEFSILLCMAAALGDGSDIDKALTKLKCDKFISQKIAALESISKNTAIDEYRKNIIIALCAHLKILNKRRNDYAHGLFEHTSDGSVRLRPFGINDTSYTLDPARVDGDIMLLDTAFRIAQFVAGRLTREQLQPHLDRLAAAKTDPSRLKANLASK